MYMFATVTIFTIVTDLVLAENKLNLLKNDPGAEDQSASTDSIPSSITPIQKSEDIPFLNAMWAYLPKSHPVQSDSFEDASVAQNRVLRPGVSITRLAKSLYQGFDPYFHRTYFEPFESRTKPVRLVALNRNGKQPRQRIHMATNEQEPNIAELQSSYNDVGNFWLEDAVMQQ